MTMKKRKEFLISLAFQADAKAIIGLGPTVINQVQPGPIMKRTMRHAS